RSRPHARRRGRRAGARDRVGRRGNARSPRRGADEGARERGPRGVDLPRRRAHDRRSEGAPRARRDPRADRERKMTGSIDRSVTLDDVFVVVGSKRVPLAPELAGYLALEIAEGAQGQGDVDPRSVFIGEEGTVALVRGREAPGDAEASVRSFLLRLLE